jgi:hypothetical protein
MVCSAVTKCNNEYFRDAGQQYLNIRSDERGPLARIDGRGLLAR